MAQNASGLLRTAQTNALSDWLRRQQEIQPSPVDKTTGRAQYADAVPGQEPVAGQLLRKLPLPYGINVIPQIFHSVAQGVRHGQTRGWRDNAQSTYYPPTTTTDSGDGTGSSTDWRDNATSNSNPDYSGLNDPYLGADPNQNWNDLASAMNPGGGTFDAGPVEPGALPGTDSSNYAANDPRGLTNPVTGQPFTGDPSGDTWADPVNVTGSPVSHNNSLDPHFDFASQMAPFWDVGKPGITRYNEDGPTQFNPRSGMIGQMANGELGQVPTYMAASASTPGNYRAAGATPLTTDPNFLALMNAWNARLNPTPSYVPQSASYGGQGG